MRRVNLDPLKFIKHHTTLAVGETIALVVMLGLGVLLIIANSSNNSHIITEAALKSQKSSIAQQLLKAQKDLHVLQNQDQVKLNSNLKAEIAHIHDTYHDAISAYEKLTDLKLVSTTTADEDVLFAKILSYLADQNYASASASLAQLNSDVQTQLDKIAAATAKPASNSQSANTVTSNSLPGGGFSQQVVNSDHGSFTIDIIAADLNSTRVIVDTASNSDCANNCPVLPLDAYVSRSGAYAGINGTFFCPADYPSCAGKTNSFDTLLMNKNKVYFNSANNVYSNVPLVYFSGNSMGVRGASSNWGRDTSVDSVIAMQPLLVSSGNIVYNGSGVAKYESKGTRGFVANKGNMAYIGDVLNATMDDSAHVLKALGVDNALNLDEGGSTALWFGGYVLGPGRNIPNAVLFVRK